MPAAIPREILPSALVPTTDDPTLRPPTGSGSGSPTCITRKYRRIHGNVSPSVRSGSHEIRIATTALDPSPQSSDLLDSIVDDRADPHLLGLTNHANLSQTDALTG